MIGPLLLLAISMACFATGYWCTMAARPRRDAAIWAALGLVYLLLGLIL